MQAGAELYTGPAEQGSAPSVMSDLLTTLASMFPMGTSCGSNSEAFENAMDTLFSCLPPIARAWSLFEAYMENASWVFQPVRREDLVEDILTPIYAAQKERQDPNSGMAETHISPHKLAVLYFIFAQGTVVDLTLPPYNAEGDGFYHYGVAALNLRSVFDSPVIETVEAIVLMAHYHSSAGERFSKDSVWTLFALAAKIGQSVR